MPEKSGFFDTTADDPREYPAREFAEYFAQFIANGVFSGGTKLKVTATGADANVMIDLGAAWINGYQYKVFDSPLVLPIVPATTQDRIDRIILRLDTSTPVRAIKAIVLQGLPSGTPSAPAIVRSGDIYDLSLAQVRVKANTTIILPENITDERLNNAVCGLVTGFIQQADTTLIFNQFQAWLNTKTAEYQQQWKDFMQSVQDEGFATTEYVDNRVLTGGYGVTTNSGNAYSVTPSPAPTALVAGLRVTVRINAANTGAATLNVNGLGAKSILKGNGNSVAAGNLKANSVYTFVYSGSAFILQGEGGGGTALASEIRSGKTATTDAGDVTGTFAVSASNYPKDVSIFGVAGLLERMTTTEKQAIANAITGKGVAASVSDSNTILAEKIGAIQSKTYGVIDINRPDISQENLIRGEAKFTPLAQLPRGTSFFSFRATGTSLDGFGPKSSEESGRIIRTYVILRNVGGAAYIRLLNFNYFGFLYYCKLISLNYEISTNMVSIVVRDRDQDLINYFFTTGIAEGPGTVDFTQPLELCFRHYMWIENSVSIFIQTGIVGRLYYA